jgi:hypothetical protein
MRTLFLLFACAALFYSCKNENQDDQVDPQIEQKEIKNYFYADVDVQATQKDDFALYYTEDNSINFTAENATWAGTKGENTKETISFKLREDRFPTNIRFDFGMNKAQDTVKVFGIKIGYENREITIAGTEFFKYFINNENEFSASIDSKIGALKIVKKGAEYKTPYFYPTDELNKKIKEITIGKK